MIGSDIYIASSEAILDLFTSISLNTPHHISEATLPLLFNSLPDRAPPRSADLERQKYWRTLAFLKRLCIQPDLFETLVVRLTTKLDLLCSPGNTSEGRIEDIEPTAAYAHSILRTLSDALAAKIGKGHTDVPKYIDRLLPRLYHLHISAALSLEDSVTRVAAGERLVAVSAEIVTMVTQTQTAQYVFV